MLNIMSLERQSWTEQGEELGKEANNAHVGLNVTESEQNRDDSTRDLEPEHQKS